MSYTTLQDDLPAVYHRIFPDLFRLPVPKESFATCADCKMVCKNDTRKNLPGTRSFLPDAKCCTYYPSLPNYLVGAILSDPDPAMQEGKRRIRDKIRQRTGAGPTGIFMPRLYSLIYNNGNNKGFGNSSKFLCPYFEKEGGKCTIWKYRESVCSTYFCKTYAGPAGKDFWDVVMRYLFQAQDSLMKYAILKLEVSNFSSLFPSPTMVKQDNMNLSIEEIDGKPTNDEDHFRIWGTWMNREEEFYIKCHQLITDLSASEYKNISGINQMMLLKELEHARDRVLNIPKVLKRNEEIDLKKGESGNYIINLKSIDVSFELLPEVVDSFNGKRDNKQVLKRLSEDNDIELDESILLALYHHSILIPEGSESHD